MRYVAMMAVVVATLSVSAIPALAQSGKFRSSNIGAVDTGYCPAGTCGPRGGPRAKNLAKCSAANCRQSGLRNSGHSVGR
jgi:hypothetical protein